jgi:hypothetical protein
MKTHEQNVKVSLQKLRSKTLIFPEFDFQNFQHLTMQVILVSLILFLIHLIKCCFEIYY